MLHAVPLKVLYAIIIYAVYLAVCFVKYFNHGVDGYNDKLIHKHLGAKTLQYTDSYSFIPFLSYFFFFSVWFLIRLLVLLLIHPNCTSSTCTNYR